MATPSGPPQRVYTESELRELKDAELFDLVRETITQLDILSGRLKSQLKEELGEEEGEQ